MTGFVSIVGAGPGDPALLTMAGQRRLARADVVIADYLVHPNLLLHAPPHAQIVQRMAGPRGGAQLKQPQVNALMLEHAQAGRYVVRLKGGDPCMFGRGAEEAQLLRAAGVDYELVPGVSSPIAAPEAAGIPVTHRDHTPAVTFVSGFEAYDKAGLSVQWTHLARSAGTIVLMMSVRNARLNAQRLIEAGREAATPAAVVRWGTRGIQRTVVGRLDTIADEIDRAGIRAPAVLVVGEVAQLHREIGWVRQRPLHGRRIVVTRPRAQALELADRLAAEGADALALPCLEVLPPQDLPALHRAVASVGDVDGVVLSSRPGVAAFFDALAQVGLDARALAGKTLAAVGPSSAAACRSRGVDPDIVPESANSEGLVAALRDANLLGAAWLHVRADTGRPQLRDAISDAGGDYRLAVGYRTARPEHTATALRSLLPTALGGEGFDAVCFASGKTARHFVHALNEAHGDERSRAMLEAAKIVVVGPVTGDAVSQLGLHVSAVAHTPDDTGLVCALRRVLQATPGTQSAPA